MTSKQSKNTKPVKRLKRNDLIAQRERQKLKHKLNKELRKERKLNENGKNKSDFKKKVTNEKDNVSSMNDTRSKNKKVSSYKRAQLEYERKNDEKQKNIEVRLIIKKYLMR